MSQMYLSLGSNLNERYDNLRRAVAKLAEYFAITALSPVYASEPWGDTDQPTFLNMCVAAATSAAPRDVLHLIKGIEAEMGRQPSRRSGPRLIDIDILFYDKLVLADPELTVPHPLLAERAFVLAPLADIIPDYHHPQTDLTVQEMLDRVDATGVERLFEMPFPSQTATARAPEVAAKA